MAQTVEQLINELSKLPKDLEVYFEDLEGLKEPLHSIEVKPFGGIYKNNTPEFKKFDLVILKGQRS